MADPKEEEEEEEKSFFLFSRTFFFAVSLRVCVCWLRFQSYLRGRFFFSILFSICGWAIVVERFVCVRASNKAGHN